MQVLDKYYLSLTLLVTIVMQLTFFGIAFTLSFDKVTDFAGCSNFLLLSLLVLTLRSTYFTRQIVLTTFTVIWSLRLGLFLLMRVIVRKRDKRFDKMREKFFPFLGFWIFQMIWVFTVSLPVTLTNASVVDSPINWFDYIGWTLWLTGFLIESIADQQKYNYSRISRDIRPEFMSSGLWSVSRHPNYFGEILLWIGIFLSSCNVYGVSGNDMKFGYVSVLSPVLTFTLLMFVSGIPMAEFRSDKKCAKIMRYINYKQNTSPLILFPPQIYKHLPNIFKLIFFFEFPIYNKYFNTQYELSDEQN